MPQRDHHSVWAADPQSTADQDWQMLAQTPQGAQAMICALLVAWMLIEEDVQTLRRQRSRW
jgi:hypothetical protein